MPLRRFTVLCLLSTVPAQTVAAPSARFAVLIQLTLSPAAAVKLASLHERIIVSASYSGDPNPGAESHVDQIGRINLGTENVEVPGRPGSVPITGSKVVPARLRWIRGPVLLNINVFSARHSGPDNILACDFFDGHLAAAVAKPVPLHCFLISEKMPTRTISQARPTE